jgi:hypothetical protein
VNSLVLSEYVPESSNQLPVIALYYFFNIGFVSVSVAASVFVLNCHFRGARQSSVPGWLKKLLFISNQGGNKITIKLKRLNESIDQTCSQDLTEIDLMKTKDNLNFDKSNLIRKPSQNTGKYVKVLLKDNNSYQLIDFTTRNILQEILCSIKQSMQALKKTAYYVKRDHDSDEWRQVAYRIDQILFTVSCVIVINTPIFLFRKYVFQ